MQLNLDLTAYLARKDDDFLDDPGSLFLQELLNDIVSDATGPKDCEVCISRHGLLVSTCEVVIDILVVDIRFIYSLSEP